MYSFKRALLASGIVLLAATTAEAKTFLDSGRIQRDIENLKNPKLPPLPPSKESEPTTPAYQGGASVKVASFKIVGASRISEKELQAQLKPYLGKTLDYNGIGQAALTLSQYYQAQGWLAKVYLPPQTVEHGIVTLAITEAKMGKMTANATRGLRLNSGFIGNMVSHNQKQGHSL